MTELVMLIVVWFFIITSTTSEYWLWSTLCPRYCCEMRLKKSLKNQLRKYLLLLHIPEKNLKTYYIVRKPGRKSYYFSHYLAKISSSRISYYFQLLKLVVQYTLDLIKILGVAKKFLKSRSFLFQTWQNL